MLSKITQSILQLHAKSLQFSLYATMLTRLLFWFTFPWSTNSVLIHNVFPNGSFNAIRLLCFQSVKRKGASMQQKWRILS